MRITEEKAIQHASIEQVIDRVIEHLSDPELLILIFTLVSGFDSRQTARVMGCSRQNVEQRLNIIAMKLAKARKGDYKVNDGI